MYITIDAGNSWVKLVTFDDDEPQEEKVCPTTELTSMRAFLYKSGFERGALSCVAKMDEDTRKLLHNLPFPMLYVNGNTPTPIKNLYETPLTLGSDRLAAVVGAATHYRNKNILVIDAGTCITLDFIDCAGNYHGGNISPGISMRFYMLHKNTGCLPLVREEGAWDDLGTTTETSIRAGVMAGVRGEIIDSAARLKNKYPDLKVVLTGGDAKNIEQMLNQENVTTEPLLVAYGLNEILKYNLTNN